MNTKKITFNSSNNENKINAIIYFNKDVKNPKGVIQVIHGMWEHTNRYRDFAKYYTDNGYIVAVHDHLGHGNSVSTTGTYGHFSNIDGDKCVIKDTYKFTKILKDLYPKLPHFIYAHSMGGIIAINMLSIYKVKFDGLILLGSHMYNLPTKLYYLITKSSLLFVSPNRVAKTFTILQHMGFGLKFIGSKDGNNWIVRKNDYIENSDFNDPDPFFFTYRGFLDIFKLTLKAKPEALSRNLEKNLPIYLLSGSDDAVTNYTKYTYKKYVHLAEKGFTDLNISIYKKARHNLINEINREEVLFDMLNFFNSSIK